MLQWLMVDCNILRPGDLFFLSERGIAQALVPSSPVQKIETESTGSFAGHMAEKWAVGFFNGFPRQPTPKDPFMLVRDYSWISITLTNAAVEGLGGGFPAGSYNDLYQYTYTSAALFVALFGEKKIAFAVWFKEGQDFEDLIIPCKTLMRRD